VPDKDMKINDKELAMAKSLIDMLYTDEFDLSEYKDEYREALLEIISKKAEGQTIEEVPVPVAAKITDLTEALRASVEEIRRRKSGGGAATATAEKPEPKRRAKSA
jgi:DNA end-binding protein Ku